MKNVHPASTPATTLYKNDVFGDKNEHFATSLLKIPTFYHPAWLFAGHDVLYRHILPYALLCAR